MFVRILFVHGISRELRWPACLSAARSTNVTFTKGQPLAGENLLNVIREFKINCHPLPLKGADLISLPVSRDPLLEHCAVEPWRQGCSIFSRMESAAENANGIGGFCCSKAAGLRHPASPSDTGTQNLPHTRCTEGH
jgi:hypothetical protein